MATKTQVLTGKVKFFNQAKGFGFIINNDNGKDVFVHVSECKNGDIEEDDDVEFEIAEGKKGVNAINVYKK